MPTAPRHSWLKSGLHFCGSCLATLACWALWIVLGATLAFLSYIAIARELPVPGYVLRQIESELSRSGLIMHFGAARFDPTGKLLLQDVRLRATQFEDPLLTCRYLYARHDLWSLLSGRPFPEEIQIEGAALHLPALLSPSGTAEPVLSDLAATFRYAGGNWRVEQFVGRFGRLNLSVHGEFMPTHARKDAPDLAQLAGRYLKFARRLAPLSEKLSAFDEPSLLVDLATAPGGRNSATLLLTANGVHQPWGQPVTTGPFAAATTLQLDRRASQSLRIVIAMRHLAAPQGVVAEAVRAELGAEFDPMEFAGRPISARVAAGTVRTSEAIVSGPHLSADLTRWPVVQLDLAAQLEGETLSAAIEASLQEKSARLRVAGRADHAFISRILTRHTPRAEPYFRFGDPVGFEAEVVLNPGWKFDHLAAWVDAGRLDSRGVPITHARGRLEINGTSLLARDARVGLGSNFARGSYWMDFKTSDYRMLLDGRLDPIAIKGWFRGEWWPQFWNRWFLFSPSDPPVGEVDLQGRWRDPSLTHNFIRAHADNARIWGGDFDAVDARLFVRPAFVHGLNLTGSRAGGREWVAGSFKRFGTPTGREPTRFEFDFKTKAEPAVLGRMLEGRIDGLLASLRFSAPPEVHVWGALAGANGRMEPDYRIAATAASPLEYYGFPLDDARIAGQVVGSEIRLQEIAFSAAGGTGAGVATLSGEGERQLGFDLHLNRAKLGETVHAFQRYNAARSGTPVPTGPDAKFVRTAANSLLDLSFSAQGNPADIASFKGNGQATLTGGQLGEVHLFGLLSQVLSGLSLSFSSLKLDTAFTSMELDRGELFFPDLKVTGPSAAIDARGRYLFATSTLDFNAKFKPYEQPGSLLQVAFSLVMNPLTSIMELKLAGPLADPKWSFIVSPGSKPATPAAISPATDTPAAGR